MRNDQNKHGPDIDIGVWYAALLRHSTDASGNCDAGKAVRAGPMVFGMWFPPWISTVTDARGDPRDGPANPYRKAREPASAEQRRQYHRRSTIAEEPNGESPPGVLKRLTMNHIDSAVRSRLPARGRLKHGEIKDNFCLKARGMPEQIIKKTRRDAIPRKPASRAGDL